MDINISQYELSAYNLFTGNLSRWNLLLQQKPTWSVIYQDITPSIWRKITFFE